MISIHYLGFSHVLLVEFSFNINNFILSPIDFNSLNKVHNGKGRPKRKYEVSDYTCFTTEETKYFRNIISSL